MKWKVFDAKSLVALLSSLTRIKETADANTSAVSSLGDDFVQFTELTERNIAGKQDKPTSTSVIIPAAGWSSDGTAGYPQYYDIIIPGVTAEDKASVDLAPASIGAAIVCGLCPACETMEGKIRLRAVSVPTASMAANYWIEKGA